MLEKYKVREFTPVANEVLPLPAFHKAELVLWLDLTVDDCDRIDELSTAEELKQFLGSRFSLENYDSDIRAAILLDLYLYTVQFAKSNNFDKPQLSALFSIIKNTHGVATETSFGNLKQTFAYFRDTLLRHSVNRPPFSVGVFTPEQARSVTEYVITTYFRHFKLYKYAFTPLVKLDIRFEYPAMPESAEELAARETSFAVEASVGSATAAKTEDFPKSASSKQKSTLSEAPSEKEKEEEGVSALKQIVREEIVSEVEKMKTSLNQALKETEERLCERLAKAGVSDKTGKSPQKKK